MASYQDYFTIQSDRRPTFHDITEKVDEILQVSQFKSGIVVIYSQHTTCSVLIQEESHDENYYGTEFLLQDMVNIFENIMPSCRTQGQYLHPGPKHIAYAQKTNKEEGFWSLNTDAHLRSCLLGRSVTIPFNNSKMELGEFGRVFLLILTRSGPEREL